MNNNHHNLTKQIEVNNFIRLFINNFKLLGVFSLCSMLCTILFVLSTPHKYTVSGYIQINNDIPTIGAHSLNSIFNKVQYSEYSTSKAEIEMVYITTPYILAPIIKQLNLDIDVTPKLLPILGKILYLNPKITEVLSQIFPLFNHKYVTNNENLIVSTFIVPTSKYETQYQLKVIDQYHYTLFDNHEPIIHGVVGKDSYSSNRLIHIRINKITAQSGAIFNITKHSMDYMVNLLTKELQVIPLEKNSKLLNSNTGVIKISLISHDRLMATSLINSIITALSINSKSENSAIHDRTLQFINSELPQVEAKLQNSEKILAKFKSTNTITLITAQQQSVLASIASIEADLNNIKITRESLKYSYGNKHPFMLALKQQETSLIDQYNQFSIKLKKFPKQEIELARLQNIVEMNQQLLKTLMERQQELQILASSEVSDIKVLNYASIPYVQQNKRSKLFVLIGAIVGALVGALFVLVVRMVRGNNNPFALKQQCNIPIIGIILYINLPQKAGTKNLNDLNNKHTQTSVMGFTKTAHQTQESLTQELATQEFSNLLILSNKKTTKILLELKLIAAKILLNTTDKIFQFFSLTEKTNTAFITLNLGVRFSNLGYKTLVIALYTSKTSHNNSTLNQQKINPQPNLCVYFLDKDLQPAIIQGIIQNILSTEEHFFDYIFIHFADIFLNISPKTNLNFAKKSFMIASSDQSSSELINLVNLLQQHNISINGIIYSYTKRYWVHDTYSK